MREAMDYVGLPPPEASASAPEHLTYDEVASALDGLTPLDLARLDAIERRYLGGTDFAEGDLLQEAMCSALFEEKRCPRTTRFMAFLVQSMRNIAGHRRNRLRQQVPIEDATTGERKSKFELKDSGTEPGGRGDPGGTGSAGIGGLHGLERALRRGRGDEHGATRLGKRYEGRSAAGFCGCRPGSPGLRDKEDPAHRSSGISEGMAAMSRDPTDLEKLSKLDQAIDDSILEASEADLREDFKEAGDDFDRAVARAGRALEQAKERAARMRFKRAQDEFEGISRAGECQGLRSREGAAPT